VRCDFDFSQISDDGSVYSWGYNEFGQLGLNDDQERFIPTEMTTLKDKKIQNIVCGGFYSIGISGLNSQEIELIDHFRKSSNICLGKE
jgi:alpha-tubulin suppressor-like RCC1 family protein